MAWNDAPPTKEELAASSNDWTKEPPKAQELGLPLEPKVEPGILSKSLDFAKNLPESAIDLVPGMKEKRENIAAERATPEYQNQIAIPASGPSLIAPGGIPAVSQGQLDKSMKESGQAELNDPAMAVIGATSESSLLDLAKMVPGLGKKLASLGPKLETSGSKMAQEAMGMNSAKDLTTEYNPMTPKMERGSDITKGTGTTAMNEGVLQGGSGQWYDNALDALQTNSKKLSPLLKSAQSKIDPNIEEIVQNVGPIATKTPKVIQEVFDGIPDTSQKNIIVRKLGQQYSKYEEKLAQADGNLDQLNQIKRELTTAAENLSPQIYNSGTAKAEATLYKRLGGVVRQHIEDLASAADPGAGDQIHQVNKTIGNLSSMLPSLQKNTRGGLPTSLKDVGQKLVGPVESFVSKSLNEASKVVQTPAGDLVQKAIAPVSKGLTVSPWKTATESLENSSMNASEPKKDNATKIAGGLYNATDSSLKNIASQLSNQAGMQHTADYLNKAIKNNDSDAKNRAIFLILQNPNSRKLVSPENE